MGSNGTVDFNGHKEILEGFWLTMGPAGGATLDLGTGGQIFIERGGDDLICVQPQTIGDRPSTTGAQMLGGTFNLNVPSYGSMGGWDYRQIMVNRGLNRDNTDGSDLLITSAITDGSALYQMPLPQVRLRHAGVRRHRAQHVQRAVLRTCRARTLLNKGTGSGGVNAVGGGLRVGDGGWGDGIYDSDVVRWLQPNQIPDSNALRLCGRSPAGWT